MTTASLPCRSSLVVAIRAQRSSKNVVTLKLDDEAVKIVALCFHREELEVFTPHKLKRVEQKAAVLYSKEALSLPLITTEEIMIDRKTLLGLQDQSKQYT